MTIRVLLTGAGGQLGRDLADALAGEVPPGGVRCSLLGPPGARSESRVDLVAADHAALAVDDREQVLEAFDALAPHVVVHAAAFTAVDACESDPGRAFRVNSLGTRHVAEGARRAGAHLVYLSTDYVFDGRSSQPYVEWDEPHPLSVYGRSKLGGEHECPPDATVVRTSWVCGARGANMVRTALRLADGDGPLRFVDDQRANPTFTADLAAALVTLALDRRPGVFHVTNQGTTSWYGFVRQVLAASGHDADRVHPISTAELDPPRPAPRPANSALENAALASSGLPLLPDWQDALERLLAALDAVPSAP
ncbi:MAG TPA: dTDP-4-dehydrorhamnose reductase [Acidimicrobiales bacterium]|nr:dTDP-4-dehydrorhamnose reductase [Acidimicrobiales bacterium]